MKRQLFLLSISAAMAFAACKNQRYLDLTSGEYIKLEKDETTGLMVNSETHKPAYIYVDTKTHDTIFGATGKVINGYVVKTSEGEYKYEGEEYKTKEDEFKNKVEGDEAKIKSGDNKSKTEDGETKEKNGN